MAVRFLLSLFILSTFSLNVHSSPFKSYEDFDKYVQGFDYEVPKLKNVMKSLGDTHLTELDPEDINILVWNMYKGDMPSWEEDYTYLAKGRDILMLQEMFLNKKMLTKFEEHEGYEYQTATSFIYLKEQARTGVTTASTIRAAKTSFQRSRVVEPVIFTPKMSIFTYYDLRGKEKQLLTVNIHAINFVTTRALAIQIGDIAKVIEKHDGPVVFAGDFNTWSPGKTRYVLHVAKRLGLTEVKFKKDTRMRTLGQILDYVFVKGIEVKSSRVWGNIEGSDHKAMEVRLKIK